MRKHFRFLSLLMAGILLFAVAAAQADDKPVYPIGQITLEATQVAAGVGYSWGGGVMKFQGKEYPFTVKGLDVAAVGISKINAVGDVYNLKTAGDLAGKYVAASAGVSLGKGASGLSMRNGQGVIINLKATQEGVQLNLGVDGFVIEMK